MIAACWNSRNVEAGLHIGAGPLMSMVGDFQLFIWARDKTLDKLNVKSLFSLPLNFFREIRL